MTLRRSFSNPCAAKKVFLMQPTSPQARNSHRGDARATEMGQRGALNVGQLTREKYGSDAVLVGFTTHHGAVTAASDWGGLAKRKVVRPALAESCEAIFHKSLSACFLLILRAGARSVRCRVACRRDAGSPAARNHLGMGSRRGAGKFSTCSVVMRRRTGCSTERSIAWLLLCV
jgi:Erythromycin esterase